MHASRLQVVEHPTFGQLFLLAIVANTVILALTTAGALTVGRSAGQL